MSPVDRVGCGTERRELVPDDAELPELATTAEQRLWPAYEQVVMALVQRQQFAGARRLLHEALEDPRVPSAPAQTFRELLSGTFGGEKEGLVLAFNPPAIQGLGASAGFQMELQQRGGGTIPELAQAANTFMNAAAFFRSLRPVGAPAVESARSGASRRVPFRWTIRSKRRRRRAASRSRASRQR